MLMPKPEEKPTWLDTTGFPEWLLSYNSQTIIEAWVQKLKEFPDNLAIIVDIDDTLINSLLNFWLAIISLAKRLSRNINGKDFLNCQSPEEFIQQPNHFALLANILGGEKYTRNLADQRQLGFSFNQRGELLQPEIPELLEIISQSAILLGGLTARPSQTRARLGTWRAMQKTQLENLFRESGILFYAGNNHFDSIDWKISILKQLVEIRQQKQEQRQTDSPQTNSQVAPVVMVDDNLELAQKMYGWLSSNNNPVNHLPYIHILLAKQPFAQAKLAEVGWTIEDQTHLNQMGVYIVTDWNEVKHIVDQYSYSDGYSLDGQVYNPSPR